ncbi:MAG: DNA polymerase IV [Paracoccaceae bacterium]|jgi:DNA polymerase IV|nr:DNA polymerase IV [Paracoccaceae bacterium]HCM99040.1 DNA polymerase IV [Rhodobacter sp.]MDO7568571.1 DNA polymerase IV [Paracoccaceae bacterium]MDO7655596.1 DNA polymerase IV [Paracoccaceae bacterium]MDO7659002.1 DNA polymerase IV [Paracoccaceae bacterium]
MEPNHQTLCRDCFHLVSQASERCSLCGSRRIVHHRELANLSIAHMDCDAFYASVEKRDNPELRDQAVIVGGGRRGIVSTCCYIARIRGVRSAMPMFQALKLCPDAVVVSPRMQVYSSVSRQIRTLMMALTPAIEPLSLDEAFLDLSGTTRLHGAPPAVLLAKMMRTIEQEIGISGSVGLSHNKFLAKIASDLDKPRGFSVIGRADTQAFLEVQHIKILWGVGTATQAALEKSGIRSIKDLLRWDESDLTTRFGQMGRRLFSLARGQDNRPVATDEKTKSVSKETTFEINTCDTAFLDGHLWRLSEAVAAILKARDLAGSVVTLKLKRSDFSQVTRRHSLPQPTQTADRIYREAAALFAQNQGGTFRLIGVGISGLCAAAFASEADDLLDPNAAKRAASEKAFDQIRAKFGKGSIIKGRALQ